MICIEHGFPKTFFFLSAPGKAGIRSGASFTFTRHGEFLIIKLPIGKAENALMLAFAKTNCRLFLLCNQALCKQCLFRELFCELHHKFLVKTRVFIVQFSLICFSWLRQRPQEPSLLPSVEPPPQRRGTRCWRRGRPDGEAEGILLAKRGHGAALRAGKQL